MQELNIKERLFEVIRSSMDIVIEDENTVATDISVEMNLVDDLGFDSIHIIMYVVGIEQEFNIAMPDDMLDFENLSNISAMLEFLVDYFKEQENE